MRSCSPASDGEIGVLPGHTPLLTTLKIGALRYRVGTTVHRMVISWGFAEVLPDRVIVLAERGVPAGRDRPARPRRNASRRRRELQYLSSHDPEFASVEARLEESVAMISMQPRALSRSSVAPLLTRVCRAARDRSVRHIIQHGPGSRIRARTFARSATRRTISRRR